MRLYINFLQGKNLESVATPTIAPATNGGAAAAGRFRHARSPASHVSWCDSPNTHGAARAKWKNERIAERHSRARSGHRHHGRSAREADGIETPADQGAAADLLEEARE